MNIRKVFAGCLAVLAAGSTVAFPAFGQSQNLGAYVDNSGATPVPPWVILGDGNGSPEYAQDVIGASDLAGGVAGYMTIERPIDGVSELSVTGGVDLSTPNTKLFNGDPLNAAKDTLTEDDMPSVLASGVFEDADGNTYEYDQYLVVGDSTVGLSDSNEDDFLDGPALLIDMGTNPSDPVYTWRVVFNDEIDFSDTDVRGEPIDIFGTEFTISPDSDTDMLVLFGSANKETITEGETTTVTVDNEDYEITLIGVSNPNTAVISVNGVTRSIDEGESRTISGLDVFCDEVFFLSKETQTSSAQFSFGMPGITLEDGQEVKLGDSEEEVDNTEVTFTQGTDGTSVIEVAVAAQDNDGDFVSVDRGFPDPAFGTVELVFGGGAPAVEDMAIFSFDTSGDDTATAKLTDHRGETSTVEWAYDPSPGNPGSTLHLADGNDEQIHVLEGETATEDEYIVVNQDGFSHLFEITNIDVDNSDTGASEDGTVKVRDVFSGTTYEVSVDEQGVDSQYFSGSKVIDGKTYLFWARDASPNEIAIVWGGGSATSGANPNPGSVTTVFPTIVAEKDAEVALINEVNIGAGKAGNAFELLGIAVTLASGANLIDGTNIMYNYNNASGDLDIEGVSGPAVVVLEEEAEDLSGSDKQNAVVVEAGDDSDGITIQTGSTTPIFSDATTTPSGSDWLDTNDNDIKVKSDRFGTLVYKNTDDQGSVDIYYPDTQVVLAAAIGPDPVFSVGGESGTVQEAYPLTTPIGKLANEITNPATLDRDVILVGGPCANALVAQLMGVSTEWPACAAEFEGLDEGLIQEYEDAFGSGHKALVVAGVTGPDTRALAAKVLGGTMSYEA